MIKIAILAMLLLAGPSVAQQQQRPATLPEMNGAAAALADQVQAIRDMHLRAEMKAAALAEENAKLRAQVQELEKKSEAKKPK
jgi:outer membrane murein-binding lipoprotein Lpp